MYAVVSVWNIEKGREEEQQRGLEELVPMVQRAPGFVAGYWTGDQVGGKAYAMILLDSEEAAHQFKAMVESSPQGRSEVGLASVPETLAVAKVHAHTTSKPEAQ